jgi:hypothetical protein
MRKLLLWVILLVVGFLLGFVPQYLKAHSLEQQNRQCDATVKLDQVRQYAALTYVAATQLNYGTAATYAQQLFQLAQQLDAATNDARTKGMLSDVLAARDKITSDLAKGDAAVVGELQPLILKLEQPS